MEVKRVAVNFGTGQDVLQAYWGYLSDGGLVLPDGGELGVGDSVSLSVRVDSLETEYLLNGKVVRGGRSEQRTVVAFDPGQPHDMLLTAAFAEADDVPPRGDRRFMVEFPVCVEPHLGQDVTLPATVVNVSDRGCCLQLAGEHRSSLPVGAENVRISAAGFSALGRVVWAHNADRGVLFYGGDSDLSVLDTLLSGLVDS